MRILVLNSAAYAEAAPGEEWRQLSAQAHAGHLYAQTLDDFIDFDVFLIDYDRVDEVGQTPADSKIVSRQIVERLAGGGCVVVFASERDVPWLPIEFRPRGLSGKRFRFVCPDEAIRAVLEGLAADMSYKTQFDRSDHWTAIAVAQNEYPIAGFAEIGRGLLLVLPEFRDRSHALREILDKVIPAKLPGLVTPRPARPDEEPPQWLSEFSLQRARELGDEVESIRAQIQALRETQLEREQEQREVAEYSGLLWLDGYALEAAVEKALNLLGIDAHPRPPVDLAWESPDGRPLFIEVEGTTSLVQLRKGQQLLSYIAQADNPADTLGAVIGNPYRTTHPSNRPQGPEELFSQPLRALAQKQGWALVTTTELFDWVRRYFEGEGEAVGIEVLGRFGCG